MHILKKLGINEIIIVGGYKIEMIRQFNEDKKLGLKVAYNPTATSVSRGWAAYLDTVKVGLRGLDDDVLLIFGDVLLTEEAVRRVIEHPKGCISVFSYGYQMYKIPRELLPKLRKLEDGNDEFGPMHTLNDFCIVNNGIKMCIKDSASMHDVDRYNQTDEGKK
ncbi:unnamed protein product [marine sediment metagenome]|uniref:DUF6564 domain-containing protein n=1 Tax=marine sediment metagenome TaxID=412755 RepID=X1S964_9ZZZZ